MRFPQFRLTIRSNCVLNNSYTWELYSLPIIAGILEIGSTNVSVNRLIETPAIARWP